MAQETLPEDRSLPATPIDEEDCRFCPLGTADTSSLGSYFDNHHIGCSTSSRNDHRLVASPESYETDDISEFLLNSEDSYFRTRR